MTRLKSRQWVAYLLSIPGIVGIILLTRVGAAWAAPTMALPALLLIALITVIGGQIPGIVATVVGVSCLTAVLQHVPHLWIRVVLFSLTSAVIVRSVAMTQYYIQQLKKTLEEKDNAIKQRDFTLSVIAHDLRQPLSTVLASASVMAVSDNEELRQRRIDRIRRSGLRMTRLVDDLLDASIINAGRLVVKKEPTDLNLVIAEACKETETEREKRTIELVLQCGEPLIINVDPQRITQVIVNLVNNAIQHSPLGGCIAVSVEHNDKECSVSVKDQGPGIQRSSIPFLFDPYWRGERTRNVGYGLGLNIVRGIVEAHGGKVFVESEIGHGTKFSFSLPAVPNDGVRIFSFF